MSLGVWESVGGVVPLEESLAGGLGSSVGVSELVFVGDSPSQMDGVGVAAADVRKGVRGIAATGASSAPPATSCLPSSDTGIAQPRDVLDGRPASGA